MKRPLQKDINTDGMPPDQWVSAVQGVGLHVTIDSKRSESENQKKTYQRTDRVTGSGVRKNGERVVVTHRS